MRAPQILCTLLALALLEGALVVPVSGQQPEEKPQAHKPLVLRPIPSNSTTNDSGPIEIENLEVLASRLLHHAPDAGCHPVGCKILVTDFVFPDGSTFPNGIWWADEISKLFETQRWTVADRTLLRDLLQKEGISAKAANTEPAARWLGKKFDATVVLVGQAKIVGSDVVELSARFLSVNDKFLIGPISDVNLLVGQAAGNPSPADLLPYQKPLPPFPDTVNGEKVYRGGVQGVGLPSCSYMPNPPYTEDAREAQFSGSVTAEAAVGSDGVVRAIRIVKGAPFGLGEQFARTLSTWKCKPAEMNGRPVATIVTFEANFLSSGPN